MNFYENDEITILDDEVLNILLKDQTVQKNIIWANDDYINISDNYKYNMPILNRDIRKNIIHPRFLKNKEKISYRKKMKAEVFTPSWVCNMQNNLVDKEWFDDSEVFNYEIDKSWITNLNNIIFPKDKTWEEYIYDKRLEVTCGEAPYIVSRYDTVNGEFIDIMDRIGILDRKMRVINENVDTEDEWIKWVKKAYQNVYGFEFNGDSLFIARKNLLLSFCDYMIFKFNKYPNKNQLLDIATIISWNIWQMDAKTYSVPYNQIEFEQLNLFDNDLEQEKLENINNFCIIKDWRDNKKILFKDLI